MQAGRLKIEGCPSSKETRDLPFLLRTTMTDLEFFTSLFESIAADLGMIMDTEVEIREPRVGRRTERVVGAETIHISFRFFVHCEGVDRQGCVLVPLADAVTLASFLMMLDPEEIVEGRKAAELDRPLKEAMLEVGNFIAGAIDAVIRTWYPGEATCRSHGCQGVRADVRPALEYEEGSELVVGWAEARISPYESFEMSVQLPPPIQAEETQAA